MIEALFLVGGHLRERFASSTHLFIRNKIERLAAVLLVKFVVLLAC